MTVLKDKEVPGSEPEATFHPGQPGAVEGPVTEDYPIAGQRGGSQASRGEVTVSWTRRL